MSSATWQFPEALRFSTYRDRAREERGITEPEMIIPITAHAAFDKAALYFNIKAVRIPIDEHFRADVAAAGNRPDLAAD